MDKDLNKRVTAYLTAVSLLNEMLKSGVISEADVEPAKDALKVKFSLKNMTIFG